MIKNNFLNYNIIYNLRIIKIKEDIQDNDINNALIPFYNICINKFYLDDKYKNILKDEYTHEKTIKCILKKELIGKYNNCSLSENNLIFFSFFRQN